MLEAADAAAFRTAKDELIRSRGHVPLKIGRGCTPFVAVLDTHAHWPYEKAYREAESRDAQTQLRRGHSLPCCSRQTILDRASDCWKQIKHETICEAGWVAAGLTNRLDGSQDQLISRVCRPFWIELEMPQIREQLKEEIASAVQSGQISSWFDYAQVLEPYDVHDPVVEGLECARERMGADDAEEAGYDTPDNASEAEEVEDEEVLQEPLAAPSNTAATGSLHETAAGQIARENDKNHLSRLIAMRDECRKLEDDATARLLDERIRQVSKLQARPSEALSAHLREKALERRQADDKARLARQESQLRLKNLKKAVQVAKLQHKTAAASAKERVLAEKQRLQEQAKINRILRNSFASQLANRLLEWCVWKPDKDALAALDGAVKVACVGKLGTKTIFVPDFFEKTRIWAQKLVEFAFVFCQHPNPKLSQSIPQKISKYLNSIAALISNQSEIALMPHRNPYYPMRWVLWPPATV